MKQFQKQNITVNDSNEYEFRKLMAILYMLSGSPEKYKMDCLFQLYDYGDNNEFNANEVSFMLKEIFTTVW